MKPILEKQPVLQSSKPMTQVKPLTHVRLLQQATLPLLLLTVLFLQSCSDQPTPVDASQPAITGTWKLLEGVTISGKDTNRVDYTNGQEMIKIITPTHFSFLRHDLQGGKDSTAVFVAGGGRVEINGNQYTEHLDYFTTREWEGNSFHFTYEIKGDTLVTTGIEKVEDLGVNHLNRETYLRVR